MLALLAMLWELLGLLVVLWVALVVETVWGWGASSEFLESMVIVAYKVNVTLSQI